MEELKQESAQIAGQASRLAGAGVMSGGGRGENLSVLLSAGAQQRFEEEILCGSWSIGRIFPISTHRFIQCLEVRR